MRPGSLGYASLWAGKVTRSIDAEFKMYTDWTSIGKLGRPPRRPDPSSWPAQLSDNFLVYTDREQLEDMVKYMETSGLQVVGWIHTHPVMSAFLSSVDQHQQHFLQALDSRCVASVLDQDLEVFGFHLTELGMTTCQACPSAGDWAHVHKPDRDLLVEKVDFHYVVGGKMNSGFLYREEDDNRPLAEQMEECITQALAAHSEGRDHKPVLVRGSPGRPVAASAAAAAAGEDFEKDPLETHAEEETTQKHMLEPQGNPTPLAPDTRTTATARARARSATRTTMAMARTMAAPTARADEVKPSPA